MRPAMKPGGPLSGDDPQPIPYVTEMSPIRLQLPNGTVISAALHQELPPPKAVAESASVFFTPAVGADAAAKTMPRRATTDEVLANVSSKMMGYQHKERMLEAWEMTLNPIAMWSDPSRPGGGEPIFYNLRCRDRRDARGMEP